MRYLTDLVWIGNTLYPRWFVFMVIAAIIILISGALSWLTR